MKHNKQKHKFNPINERIKYKYRIHLLRVGKKDIKTIDAILPHIREYEIFMDFKGFDKFNDKIADKYMRHLLENNY